MERAVCQLIATDQADPSETSAAAMSDLKAGNSVCPRSNLGAKYQLIRIHSIYSSPPMSPRYRQITQSRRITASIVIFWLSVLQSSSKSTSSSPRCPDSFEKRYYRSLACFFRGKDHHRCWNRSTWKGGNRIRAIGSLCGYLE